MFKIKAENYFKEHFIFQTKSFFVLVFALITGLIVKYCKKHGLVGNKQDPKPNGGSALPPLIDNGEETEGEENLQEIVVENNNAKNYD